ncbi:hypothetical protein CesoFtcFv8_026406 [Champsocephalus esox]|uniref:Uncharacterized protein n=1 Tax=Champsocephalus esox TaxID=159716 RepID=A0AAN8B2Y2_9TELE|nr:hypothetical protein CesoFtcFv8_026406 [Champsocephalus esox]
MRLRASSALMAGSGPAERDHNVVLLTEEVVCRSSSSQTLLSHQGTQLRTHVTLPEATARHMTCTYQECSTSKNTLSIQEEGQRCSEHDVMKYNQVEIRRGGEVLTPCT